MFPKFSTRKLVQISEEALPPVHAPVFLDNQFFILTQQDVRKLEEYRLLTLHKLMPNGELKPLGSMDLTCQQNLFELINYKMNESATNAQQTPQPMDTSLSSAWENSTKASIDQQLQWDKFINTSAPFPMTYSCITSTTEISNKEKLKNFNACSCCKTNEMYSKSTCTQDPLNECKRSNQPVGAREQLKQKKINNTLAFID